MFKEHNFAVWGDYCECGCACSVLQNKFHPWEETDFKIKLICPSCSKDLIIDNKKASEFYNKKIFSYFRNLDGIILDLGCGQGFISSFLIESENVKAIYAVDIDISCRNDVEKLNNIRDIVKFINADASNLESKFAAGEVDYVVGRDVFMFIEDTQKFFDDIERTVKKGIRLMGWYVSGSSRMKNNLLPEQIAGELKRRGFDASIEDLDWYKCGYFIRADK